MPRVDAPRWRTFFEYRRLSVFSPTLRKAYGNTKDIWSWTGYTWEELMQETEDKLELLSLIDILWMDDLNPKKDLTLQFREAVISALLMYSLLKTGEVVLWSGYGILRNCSNF